MKKKMQLPPIGLEPMLCSCGNKSVGISRKGEPFCFDCVKGATAKEIFARMPVIKDKKFIEWLKGLGRE